MSKTRKWMALVVLFILVFPVKVMAADGTNIEGLLFKDKEGNEIWGLTDGDTSTNVISLKPGEYVQLVFDQPVILHRYQFFGSLTNDPSRRVYLYNDAGEKLFENNFGISPSGASYSFTQKTNVKRIRVLVTGGTGTLNLAEIRFWGSGINKDTDPPATPTGLTGTAGDTLVNLRWNAVSDSDLRDYKVYVNGTYRLTVASTSATITGLTNDTNYRFSVSAVDKAGNESVRSAEITLTPKGPPPPDTTPPAVPIGLTGRAGNKQAILTWTANKESDLAGYVIYQDGQKLRTVSGTTFTVTGLDNGKTYAFRITAYDLSGNESAKSNEVKVTPAEKIEVVAIPNLDSIILQIRGGSPPYQVDWGLDVAEVNTTQFTIPGLTAKTSYTITITDAGGLKWTGTINTGDQKAYVPPAMPNPQDAFQRMLDVFGVAGTIAVAIIGGAILLGIMCLLALWAWRLLKRWLARAK